MTIVTTMCKLLFAMLIGFYLFKKDILTKEVNAKLSSLIVQITCPCIILNSLSTVSHEDTGMILKLFLAGVVMYVIFPIPVSYTHLRVLMCLCPEIFHF